MQPVGEKNLCSRPSRGRECNLWGRRTYVVARVTGKGMHEPCNLSGKGRQPVWGKKFIGRSRWRIRAGEGDVAWGKVEELATRWSAPGPCGPCGPFLMGARAEKCPCSRPSRGRDACGPWEGDACGPVYKLIESGTYRRCSPPTIESGREESEAIDVRGGSSGKEIRISTGGSSGENGLNRVPNGASCMG